jgi:hypothetical protein
MPLITFQVAAFAGGLAAGAAGIGGYHAYHQQQRQQNGGEEVSLLFHFIDFPLFTIVKETNLLASTAV